MAQALAEITGGQLPTASIGFADALARCWPGAGLTERHFDRVGTRARDWQCGQHRVELRSR